MKKITMFLLLAIMCCGLTVYAATLDTASIDYGNGTVKISGNAGEALAGRFVSLQILNPGKDPEGVLTEDGVLKRSEQGFVSDDGSFEFVVPFEGETGEYSYFVGIDGLSETLFCSEPFKFYGDDESNRIVNMIKSAVKNNSLTDIAWIIENRADLLQIDTSEYYGKSEEDKERIYKGIIMSKPESISGLKESFEEVLKVNELYNVTEKDEFSEKAAELMKKATDITNGVYEAFTEDEKEDIISELMQEDFYCESDFTAIYTEKVLLKKLNASQIWTEVSKFITDYSQLDEKDTEAYKTLISPQIVAAKLLSKLPYDSIETFGADLAYEAAKQRQEEKGKSSGSGSGGGKSVSFTASAEIVYPEKTEAVFSDLYGYDWAKSDIEKLYEKKIVIGDGGKFYPSKTVTRAEFLTMLVRVFDLPLTDEDAGFNDITETDWYAPFVNAGYEAGIVKGTGDGGFSPQSEISRRDIAVMIYAAAQKAGIDFEGEKGVPTDYDELPEYAKEAVENLFAGGIISGYTDGSFKGEKSASRAEAAVLIGRVAGYII